MQWKKLWTLDDVSSLGVRIVMKGVVEGLRRNGIDVHEMTFDPHETNNPEKIREDITHYQPDVVLLPNHPVSFFLRQFGVEYGSFTCVTWFFDDPAIMGNARFQEHEIVLVMDPACVESARRRGAEKVFFVPVAAPDTVPEPVKSLEDIPLAYVGSIYIPRDLRQQVRPEQIRFVMQLVQKKVANPHLDFEELADFRNSDGSRMVLPQSVRYLIYCEANRLYRIRFMQALAPMGLRLYGNSLWQKEIQGTPLESCFLGRLEPFQEFPDLIRCTAVNINLRSLQGFYAPVSRDFQVPRLGAFLLSSQVQLNPWEWERSEEGRRFYMTDFPWSPQARTPRELAGRARYYLENPSARQDWISLASGEIEKHHTYSKRIAQLVELLGEKLR